jgi:hypothetical protein
MSPNHIVAGRNTMEQISNSTDSDDQIPDGFFSGGGSRITAEKQTNDRS